MRLPDVDTGRLSGLKYKLTRHFKLVVDMGGVSYRKYIHFHRDLSAPAIIDMGQVGAALFPSF